MRLRDIRYGNFNSALARRVLRLIYRSGSVHRLWFGPLRGMRLQYDPSINFHAMLGLWDTETFILLKKLFVTNRLVAEDSTVVDVGANIGYYSLWLSTVVAPRGHVYCFEPSPDVVRIFQKNLALNGVNNVEIIETAIGDHTGPTTFFLAPHHHRSSLHAGWAGGELARSITVPMTTLDSYFSPESGRQPPSFIKFDIEGGGTQALPGCQRIIQETRPFLLVESHTPDEDRAISNVLCHFDYRGYRLNDRKWVGKPEATYPNDDGVWGNVLLIPAERYSKFSQLV